MKLHAISDRAFRRFFDRWPLPIGTFMLLLSILTVLWGCSAESSGQRPTKGTRKDPAVPVTVGDALSKTIPVELLAIGNVQAYSTVTVKAQVEGTLMHVSFREGQEVKKQDLLFTIDSRPFAVQLKQAEANLARDRAQAENARQQVRRYEELVQKEYVTPEQYEQIRTNAAALEATLRADEASVDHANLQFAYSLIRSPIDGISGNLLVHPGNLVKANDADHPLADSTACSTTLDPCR